MELKGSIVALITPFDEEGEVDYSALEALLRWHIEEGTEGLLLCGSTGEGAALTKEEKCEIFRLAVHVVGGKVPLIGATGTNVTRESVALTRKAKEIGLDAVIAIVPYYSKPTVEGCIRHFEAIAEIGLPTILYHHPGRTGTKLSIDAITRIGQIPGIIGIKDASGDLAFAQEIIEQGELLFFSGDDSLCLAHMAVGAIGSISVIGNVIPKEWGEFVDEAISGDFHQAREKYYSLYNLAKTLVLETNPQCVKYAVHLLGKCRVTMRLPLLEPMEETKQIIASSISLQTLV
ncbi:MAG: 4-hydroxy-tetrahydrodipicolinate synthase [Chlamydiae bacterium]|nr:4-hydroxy-tetrahydrodipicolinate synthase [Chlamydiota bacterium]